MKKIQHISVLGFLLSFHVVGEVVPSYDLDSLWNDTSGRAAQQDEPIDYGYDVVEDPIHVKYKGVDYYGEDAEFMLEVIRQERLERERREREEASKGDVVMFCIIFGSILVPVVIYLLLRLKYRKEDMVWTKGIYPDDYKFTRDHLLEAYIRLSVVMIYQERSDLKEKIGFVSSFIHRHFPNHDSDLDYILNYSIKNPVDLNSAATWLNRNLKKESQRIRIIYFLCGISMIDGRLSPREHQLLRQLNSLLGLSPSDLDTVIKTYQEQDKYTQSKQTVRPRSSQLQSARELLNVGPDASKEEIKKAYRSLAKRFHPDKYTNASKAKQHGAERKFIEIQEAYELLSKT